MDRLPFDPYDFFGYLASGLLLVVGMELTLGFPRVLGQDLKIVDMAVLLLGIYVAGQILATPAKALLEDLLLGKILCRPSINLFREKRPWVRGFLFPGFYTPLPEPVQKKVRCRAQREGTSAAGEDLFLHVRYCPDILKDDKLMAKLDSFRNKYGFARNLAFTSLVFATASAMKASLGSNPELVRYAAAVLAAGVLLFYRYLKFFRQYSYEMFNTYGGVE
ncbi:MAG: hypothetical protein ABSD47_07285 [Candidatus Methylomirabilota bacterium]|jgi:hypothetical protein